MRRLGRHTLPKQQRPSETIEAVFSDSLTFRLPRQIPRRVCCRSDAHGFAGLRIGWKRSLQTQNACAA
ncbi:hypothetical protein [Kingella potus]|uniref:hypothetical protein n=1 Tax=Kingella potus TaxID=265175 RepID=UPI001FD24261|nr:hypothetical protein [Kingella potus]UOP01237.1 hypothetical protein LVJ84_02895 [Kingella potus]